MNCAEEINRLGRELDDCQDRSAQEMVDTLSDEDKSQISDGFHTFKELYEHRAALFIALAHCLSRTAWKSRCHADDTMYTGYFIAGINLPKWGRDVDGEPVVMESSPITYHLEDKYWDMLDVSVLRHAPTWDGHTPQDVVSRLLTWTGGM